ncbi:helix-turn-helix transcriptional regulator [Candidatus Saccharibacteria bacterium]|nr:helix-turn-helix transcriptional regulator [Candidatus Saccharibacteria bacterium]
MEMKSRMEPSGKLKEILATKKWNQMELAGKFGVSTKTMSFWVNGKKNPLPDNIKKIDTLYEKLFNSSVRNTVEREIQNIQAKQELDEKDKENTLTEEKYYEGKELAFAREYKNNARIYLFPSTSGKKDEWYKVGGRSLLFYRYILAPRLGRDVKTREDTDKLHRFKYGIASVRWGFIFIEDARALGYRVERMEYGMIMVDLGKIYSPKEIREMEKRAKKEREVVKVITKPKYNFPDVEMTINDLARVLPSKIKKLDGAYRQLFGTELFGALIDIQKLYFRMANGHLEKSVAKLRMLEKVDDLIAMIRLIDEGGFLSLTARTRLGENVINIQKEIEKNL